MKPICTKIPEPGDNLGAKESGVGKVRSEMAPSHLQIHMDGESAAYRDS